MDIEAVLPGWASDTSDVPLVAIVRACIDTLQARVVAAEQERDTLRAALASRAGGPWFGAALAKLATPEQVYREEMMRQQTQRDAEILLTIRGEQLVGRPEPETSLGEKAPRGTSETGVK